MAGCIANTRNVAVTVTNIEKALGQEVPILLGGQELVAMKTPLSPQHQNRDGMVLFGPHRYKHPGLGLLLDR